MRQRFKSMHSVANLPIFEKLVVKLHEKKTVIESTIYVVHCRFLDSIFQRATKYLKSVT